MKFTQCSINEKILTGIEHAGFEECMPVQEQTFAYSLDGKDVLVQSQTGSGKTAAFLVTAFNNLLKSDGKKRALIIAPTRELALQIEKDAKVLGKGLDFIIGAFYGGVGYKKQEDLLARGVHIMIATPGRLIDFMDQKKIPVKDISIVIIDEADRLFDMGFFPDIKKILRNCPRKEERQTMLFSATLSDRVKDLATRDMNSPEEVLLNPDQITVENIGQTLYHVGNDEKISLLLGLLKHEDPKNLIIFTNTKREAEEVAARMEINGYKCEYIIGDLPQSKRLKVIDDLKSGKIKYLVATDVAARGLHVDDLEMVVNYDLPEHTENYVHRIGRTARAGKTGKAITFVCEKYVYSLKSVEDYIEMKIPVEWFDDDYLEEDKSAGIAVARKRTDKRKNDRGSRDRKQPQKRQARKKSTTAHSQKSSPTEKSNQSQPQGKKKRPGNNQAAAGQTGKTVEKRTQVQQTKQKTKNINDRLEYYSQKYGEEFKVKEEPKKKKQGFISRIKKAITRK